MIGATERNAVKAVAKASPWLAPFPSAFFVARSAMAHLDIPLPVAVVVAAIVETLGLASVHTWLWLSDWNTTKRKSDPEAPVSLAVFLGAVYLVTTIGLTVILEVEPALATYAPALFPILAVVGAVNLALIAQQEQRERAVKIERQARKAKRQSRRKAPRQSTDRQSSSSASNNGKMDGVLNALQAGRLSKRDARMDALVQFYVSNPDAGPTEAGDAIGVSRQTVYNYLNKLEDDGRVRRNGDGVEVIGGNGHH